VKSFLNIRNLAIKTAVMGLGMVCMVASVYNSVLWGFLLTEKKPEKEIYWWLLIVGFFLALGGAFYNSMADAIVKAFSRIVDKLK